MVDVGRTAPAVDVDAPRFQGWRVVAGAFVVLFVSSGLGFYALAVYLDALTDDGGLHRRPGVVRQLPVLPHRRAPRAAGGPADRPLRPPLGGGRRRRARRA